MIKKNKTLFVDKISTDIFLILLSAFFLTSLTYKFNLAAYFVIAPLLIIIYRRDFKTTVIFCALTGLITSLFTFDWVYRYMNYLYPIVIVLLILFFAVFGALTHLLYHRMKHLSLLVAPSVWIWLMLLLDLTKYGSYIFEFSMYNPLSAPLIWLIGGRGVTFVIIMLNSAIAEIIIKKTKWKILSILGIVVVLISCYAYSSFAEPSGEPLSITLVQGNFDQTWKWRQDHVIEILNTYKSLSKNVPENSLIVWPEYALPVDIRFYPQILREIETVSKNNKAYLILGSLIYDPKSGDHYDAAFLFSKNGSIADYYKSVYPAFYNRNSIGSDEELRLLTINGKKAGVMMCAEEAYSKVARLQANTGAQFFISLANDQNLTRGVYLSSLYPRLRAAENYKPIVRASNTGVTQIINPYGKVYKIEEGKRNILIGETLLNEHKTPYTIYGNMPLYVIILLVTIFAKKRKDK